MNRKTENTKRLARNTLMLYGRSLFCLLLSLYSSRLFLQALGIEDYGVYNAVAGFASMFSLVSGSLSSAISRFLNYEQGTGNQDRQRRIFSVSLTIMILLSLVMILLAETIGVWFVQHKLNIPDGRETAAMWAFQFAVISVMSSFIVSPFNSAIISHEKMDIYALMSILEAILHLSLALFLTYGTYSVDRLILYAGLSLLIMLIQRGIAIIYALSHFIETRFKVYFEKDLFRELFSYAGWHFVGTVSNTLGSQGINILLNIFCGPGVNAARGLARTVKNAIVMFVNNFTVALTPQITKAYAQRDMNYVKSLVYKGSKFCFYILFIISLPVLMETEFILNVWLTEVPEHTVNFVRLILVINLMGLFYVIFGTVQNATGIIRNYNLMLSFIVLMRFPLSWIALKCGLAPEVTYIIQGSLLFFSAAVTLIIVQKTMKYSFGELFREIYFPEIKVMVCSLAIPIVLMVYLPSSWWRFLLVCATCFLISTTAVLFIGCSSTERAFIYKWIRRFISRFINLKQPENGD